jgi:CheY-like chemotaxis protein
VATPTSPAVPRAQSHPVTRILIVDDDEAMRRLARRILEGCGYEILTAADGPAALCATRSAMVQPGRAIHLVLIDSDMPGSDGYALGRQLAVTWPALPVIYMSGTTQGPARRAQLVASEYFIEKPFSTDRLRLTIGLVLARCAQAAGDDPISESGDPMTNGRETSAAVREAVRAAVEYLDEEERWVLLQRWLEIETTGRGKAAKRSLKLEALRSIVCPRVGDREWDGILREHRTVRWAAELRLANVTAILSGWGGSQPVPGTSLGALESSEAPNGGAAVS